MKRIKIILSLTLCLMVAGMKHSVAQERSFQQGTKMLLLDGIGISIDNVYILDSIGAGNKMVNLVFFEMSANTDQHQAIIKKLQSCQLDNKTANAYIIGTNFNGRQTEERKYNAVVEEMLLPAMDASAKTSARIRVKLRSNGVSVRSDIKEESKIPVQSKGNATLTANFRLTVGGLPTQRVAKISPITLTGNQSVYFTVDISDADIKAWQDWLMGGAGKREQGMIEWLAPNMKDAVMKITLKDLEIVSFSDSYASNDESIRRGTIGLRARAVSIGEGK